jgi:hypothetical protein
MTSTNRHIEINTFIPETRMLKAIKSSFTIHSFFVPNKKELRLTVNNNRKTFT